MSEPATEGMKHETTIALTVLSWTVPLTDSERQEIGGVAGSGGIISRFRLFQRDQQSKIEGPVCGWLSFDRGQISLLQYYVPTTDYQRLLAVVRSGDVRLVRMVARCQFIPTRDGKWPDTLELLGLDIFADYVAVAGPAVQVIAPQVQGTAPLSVAEAEWIASGWLKDSKAFIGPSGTRFDKLAEALARAAAKEAASRGVRSDDVETLVSEAVYMLDDLQLHLDIRPDFEGPTSSDEEHKAYREWRRNNGRIWYHRDDFLITRNDVKEPRCIYQQGSEYEVEDTAAKYLSRPWLHNDRVDYLIVDALVYASWWSFTVSNAKPPDPKGCLPTLKTMIGEWLEKSLQPVLFGILAIWWVRGRYDANDPAAPMWAFGLTVFMVLVFIRALLARSRAEKVETPEQKADRQWTAMRNAYRSLSGSVLSPSRVREELLAAEKEGVVWPAVIWPVLEAAIVRNPAIWNIYDL